MKNRNLPASVAARLRNISKERNETYDFVLARFAMERFLFRLGSSAHADRFVLKGALLFYMWRNELHRATRDIDFLGYGPAEISDIENAFKEISQEGVPEDGLIFQADSIRAEPIREDASYEGIRVRLLALLANTRIPLQIDIGFGDAVTPAIENHPFPVLLPTFPAPQIRAYPVYSVVAEKLEAMVKLGLVNTRLKDYFDLAFILESERLDPDLLATAVERTFANRETPLPTALPDGLSVEFGKAREVMWRAFLNRTRISENRSLSDIIELIRRELPFAWVKKQNDPGDPPS